MRGVSQSPSLRGSGRFVRRKTASARRSARLNPLHCGAVVASWDRLPSPQRFGEVSIPFIAGQWSLRSPYGGRGRRRERLNPLHCGAVVASAMRERTLRIHEVSIPFIAGQWSLPGYYFLFGPFGPFVSIPFIAGQWSLRKP